LTWALWQAMITVLSYVMDQQVEHWEHEAVSYAAL
jgi:hypothetical protein